MQGKIALEEHFANPETAADSMGYFPSQCGQKSRRVTPTSTACGCS